MPPNFEQLADQMKEATEARPDREYLTLPDEYPGTIFWILSITGVLYVEQQNNQERVFLEMVVLDTNHPEMSKGTLCKESFALVGVENWRIKSNLGVFKGIMRTLLGIKNATGSQLESAMNGGEDSTLAGKNIKVMGKWKKSEKGREYVSKTYLLPSNEELTQTTILEPEPEPKAVTEDNATNPEVVEVDLGDDVDPPF
jgi:hypothetical protein